MDLVHAANILHFAHMLTSRTLATLAFGAITAAASAQPLTVTYAGNSGREAFYALHRLGDGTFLVGGAAEDLDWIDADVPRTAWSSAGITNSGGPVRIAFILRLSADLQTPLEVAYLPSGVAHDIRFIKSTSLPNAPGGDLFISGNTSGGYFLGKLNSDWISGTPTGFDNVQTFDASGYVKENHPWDVGSDGKVVHVTGETHGYDWSAMYRLDANGEREVVEHWRVHWMSAGGEWYGTPSSTYSDAANPLSHSGVVFKRGGRCDLRSWNTTDFTLIQADGNGGTKQGKWPLDFMFNAPCDPNNSPTSNGPGYTGYNPAATPIYGASIVTIDRRDNSIYLGMNMKTTLPGGEPDFEPAVIKFNADGSLAWWSRLYHEIQPGGALVNSSPDQYIDGIAVDYSQPLANADIVVNARCHGNNVENLWEGNTIAATPGASGFQNTFTGTNGNIHISWLGKLACADGTLKRSTYVAEYVEGNTNFGAPLAEPNLANWPNPNTGWPDVNTTRLARAAVRTTADGSVCVAGVGRRTMTTANAWQQMPLPSSGLTGTWSQFVRVYAPDLSAPKYSSLVVGEWNTANGSGGDNTDIYALWKTADGIVAVGRQRENNSTPGTPQGNTIPVTNVPSWGQAAPQNESAVLLHFTATNLADPDDGPDVSTALNDIDGPAPLALFPNPAQGFVQLALEDASGRLLLIDATGRTVMDRTVRSSGYWHTIPLEGLASGLHAIHFIPDAGTPRTALLMIAPR